LGDTSGFGRITRIVDLGDRLLVLDALMDPHLSVVDVASGRLVEHFGRNGEGPKEFRAPYWAFRGDGANDVWVYDYANARLTLVDLAAEVDHRISRTISLPVGATLESPTWFGDTLVSNGIFSDYSLMVIDGRGTPVRRITSDPPFHYRQLQHWVGLRQLNRTFLAHDPARRRMVLAYQWDDRLDFFGADGALLGTARGPRSTRPSYHLQNGKFFWNDDTEMAYCDVTASDAYVFALYAGPAPDTPHVHRPSKVHVFTWKGEFVAELALDRPVWAISVGRDGRTLYAPFDTNEGHYLIGVWQVPPSVIPVRNGASTRVAWAGRRGGAPKSAGEAAGQALPQRKE
ncbi:MAG: BF3164 family lipoprotein, partial [Longimicrobiaceae bacterium]